MKSFKKLLRLYGKYVNIIQGVAILVNQIFQLIILKFIKGVPKIIQMKIG